VDARFTSNPGSEFDNTRITPYFYTHTPQHTV